MFGSQWSTPSFPPKENPLHMGVVCIPYWNGVIIGIIDPEKRNEMWTCCHIVGGIVFSDQLDHKAAKDAILIGMMTSHKIQKPMSLTVIEFVVNG